MASEILLTASLQFAKGGVTAAPLAVNGLGITVAGSKYIRAVQSIGFAAEEAIVVGELGTLGYGIYHNLDATNFITIRSATGVTTGVKLLPGEYAVFRHSSNAPFAIADTAACLLEYFLVEA